MAHSALQIISSNPLIQKLAQSAPALINGALVLILGYWLADLVWAMVPVEDGPEAPPARTVVASQQGGGQKTFYGAKIANQHLFGEANAPAVKTQEREVKGETRLDLVLRGVLAHNPEEKALAMISRGNGPQDVYKIGDTLPGNVELVEIHRDKVIIDNRGRYETLTLEQIKGVQLQTAQKPVAAKSRPAAKSIPPSRARQLRQEFLNNPSKLLSMVNIKQQRSGGQLTGYQVEPKGDSTLFHELGLQSGDVLVSVNGVPLSNAQGLNKLRGADRYDVVVLRGGAEVPLSIGFQ